MLFKRTSQAILAPVIALALCAAGTALDANAAPQRSRGEARASVNNASRSHRTTNNTTVNNRSRNVNRNVNVNSNRDVNINVDNRGGRYDDHYHPVATAAAVTATAVVTTAVVGSIINASQMPPNCVQVMRGNAAYMQCGSTWYQPQYQGSNVTYIVVNQP